MDAVLFFEVRSEVLQLRIVDTMCRLFVYVYLKHPFACRCEGDQIHTLCLCYPLRRTKRAEEGGRRMEERKRWEEEREEKRKGKRRQMLTPTQWWQEVWKIHHNKLY
jgi:hypothetical protein